MVGLQPFNVLVFNHCSLYQRSSYFRVSEVTFLIFASWLKTSRLLGEIGKEKYDIMNDENAQKVFIYVYIHT